MKKISNLTTLSVLALGFSAFNTTLLAQQEPPIVSFTVSGTSGDYTLDFTVNNGSPGTGNQDIYAFGVYDPNGTVSADLPASFTLHASLNLFSLIGDGTTLIYNDVWVDPPFTALPPGSSLSGFDILDTSATVPTSLPYFALGFDNGNKYSGPDNLNSEENPLFEGNATSGAVPDAGATMTLLGISLGALGGLSRKLRKA